MKRLRSWISFDQNKYKLNVDRERVQALMLCGYISVYSSDFQLFIIFLRTRDEDSLRHGHNSLNILYISRLEIKITLNTGRKGMVKVSID